MRNQALARWDGVSSGCVSEERLLAHLHDPGHNQAFDADETANVILHPLFLMLRVFDNAKPARSSGCLSGPQPRSISKTPLFNLILGALRTVQPGGRDDGDQREPRLRRCCKASRSVAAAATR